MRLIYIVFRLYIFPVILIIALDNKKYAYNNNNNNGTIM